MDFSFKFASSSKLVEKLLDTHSVRERAWEIDHYFVLPPFIKNDPFAKYVYPKKSNDSHWKNLRIEGAYKITLGGGIYYGTYLKKEPIVLKEGRFGIGIGYEDQKGNRQA